MNTHLVILIGLLLVLFTVIIYIIKAIKYRHLRTSNNGTPPVVDTFINFCQCFNGVIYSPRNAKFIYNNDNVEHLYKISNDDFFLIKETMYNGLTYSLLNKDKTIKYLTDNINLNTLEYILKLLKSEFNYDINLDKDVLARILYFDSIKG